MADPTTYNLDNDAEESYTFTIKGNVYKFRHMNTEEMEKMSSIKDSKEQQEYLYQFITPNDPKTPPFQDSTKSFTIPMWRAFMNMVEVEMSIDKDNPISKADIKQPQLPKPNLDASKK